MIMDFVKAWDARKGEIEAMFRVAHPSYETIVEAVVKIINAELNDYEKPDPERITKIDYGSYQGTLLFIIGGSGYQPDNFWFVKVYYGSCSGCDTLESIRSYDDDPPSDKQVADYMTLALHVLQGIKPLDGEAV